MVEGGSHLHGADLKADECLEIGPVSHVVPAGDVLSAASISRRRLPATLRWPSRLKRMMRMGMNENFGDYVHHVFLQLLPLFDGRLPGRHGELHGEAEGGLGVETHAWRGSPTSSSMR